MYRFLLLIYFLLFHSPSIIVRNYKTASTCFLITLRLSPLVYAFLHSQIRLLRLRIFQPNASPLSFTFSVALFAYDCILPIKTRREKLEQASRLCTRLKSAED